MRPQNTEAKKVVGNRAKWDQSDELDLEFVVTRKQVDNEPMIVEVHYKHLTSSELIGTGSIYILGLMTNMGTVMTSPKVEIVGKEGQVIGHVLFDAKIVHKPKELDILGKDINYLSYVNLEHGGLIIVRHVRCKELKNVENVISSALGSKNDPFVRFSIGKSSFPQRTSVRENVGRQATWDISKDDFDIELDVSKEDLIESPLLIEVMDHNLTHTKLIGRVEVPVHNLLKYVDKHIELPTLEIFDSSGCSSGTVKIQLTLVDKPPTHSLEENEITKKVISNVELLTGGLITVLAALYY